MYSIDNAKAAFEHEERNYYFRRWKKLKESGGIDKKTKRIIGTKRKVVVGFIDGIREFEIRR